MNTNGQTLHTTLAEFLTHLAGKNRSPLTLEAYERDLTQFFDYVPVQTPHALTKRHIADYLTYLLEERELSGVSAARKLAAIREYCKYLVFADIIASSPAEKIESPHQEKKTRRRMRKDEYTQLLAHAGPNARDFAMFTVLLQCGLRVSELCHLAVSDVDLKASVLLIRDGKGQVSREVMLEKKARRALATYMEKRDEQISLALFLNRYGEPLSRFGVHKLIEKYCKDAGIERRVSAHIFRHTWLSEKADRNVPLLMLQNQAGHKNPKNTSLYYHLNRDTALHIAEQTSL